eukprot:g7713.t1
MKSTTLAALCIVLCYALLTNGARLDRTLKQNRVSVTASSSCTARNGRCDSTASVTSQAIDDAARSIATALSKAVAQAEGEDNVNSSAFAFAQAIAQAYARIITSYVLVVNVTPGSFGCARGSAYGRATADSIAQATSRAFSESTNDVASAAANCFSEAVSSAVITVTQNTRRRLCVTNGHAAVVEELQTIGFVQAVATAFSSVFTNIRDGNASADAVCVSSGSSIREERNSG